MYYRKVLNKGVTWLSVHWREEKPKQRSPLSWRRRKVSKQGGREREEGNGSEESPTRAVKRI